MNDYKKEVIKVATVTLITNTILAVFKLIIGYVCCSVAIISDGIHTASDVVSTFIVVVGVKFASKQSDKEHPYGHERFECVAAFILSIMLFIMAGIIIVSGIAEMLLGKKEMLNFGKIAMMITVISIVTKEWMFRYTKRTALKIQSEALLADAWHHRSDALSSIGSMFGVIGFYFGYNWLDILASIFICGCIVKVAITIFKDTINKMVDCYGGDALQQQLQAIINQFSEVLSVDMLKTRQFGNRFYVDIEISVVKQTSLVNAHLLTHQIYNQITKNIPKVKHCMIHVNPK